MRGRPSSWLLRGFVVAILVLPSCSSRDGGEDATPPATGSGATGS